jgi:hypothetical protein
MWIKLVLPPPFQHLQHLHLNQNQLTENSNKTLLNSLFSKPDSFSRKHKQATSTTDLKTTAISVAETDTKHLLSKTFRTLNHFKYFFCF